MRKFLAGLALASVAFAAAAQESKPNAKGEGPATKKRSEVTLRIGDAPPPLRADRWLSGAEIKGFEKGQVYVVDFWATWCGPCIVLMPHTAELYAEYKDKGVTIVGYSKGDATNSPEKVETFVKRRGPRLGYSFCFAKEPDVYESWMGASGFGSIPCCFVIDRNAKIAFIGHPLYLDFVLPKVVDGTWTRNDLRRVDEIEKDVDAIFGAFDEPPETFLKTLGDFEKKYPALKQVPYFLAPRLDAMLKLKKYDDARIVARNLMTRARKNGDDMLYSTIARSLLGPEGRAQKPLLELARIAAEEASKLLGDDDHKALIAVAQASYAAGDKSRGKSFSLKAFAAAELKFKPSAAMQLAETAIEENDKATGIEFIERAVKSAKELDKYLAETMDGGSAPSEATILADAAAFFLMAGDKPAGGAYAKKAVEAAALPETARIKVALARTYLVAGELKTGETYAMEALAVAADRAKPILMSQLAMTYYRIGEKATARDYADKSLANASPELQKQLRPALRKILADPEGKPNRN